MKAKKKTAKRARSAATGRFVIGREAFARFSEIEGIIDSFNYDLDENFVPSIDDLVLFEKLHTQLTRYLPISDIVVHRMRNRARGIS